jgi:hypothetical protein
MKDENYHARIKTRLSAKEALKKIQQVPGWWGTSVKGRPRKLKDTFTIHFGETWVTFKVTEVDADRKTVWEVTGCHLPWLKDQTEWTGTQVVWELAEKKSGTQIDFTHLGLVPQAECYGMCRKGWNYHIKKSLRQFLETGTGLPDQR